MGVNDNANANTRMAPGAIPSQRERHIWELGLNLPCSSFKLATAESYVRSMLNTYFFSWSESVLCIFFFSAVQEKNFVQQKDRKGFMANETYLILNVVYSY